jgi:hypothetical protein
MIAYRRVPRADAQTSTIRSTERHFGLRYESVVAPEPSHVRRREDDRAGQFVAGDSVPLQMRSDGSLAMRRVEEIILRADRGDRE